MPNTTELRLLKVRAKLTSKSAVRVLKLKPHTEWAEVYEGYEGYTINAGGGCLAMGYSFADAYSFLDGMHNAIDLIRHYMPPEEGPYDT
jgi:hypothetical protein